ncbi:unnamed protein product [Brachionus calyciflorus]|uniref:U3 small nucleolar RNA-associated protein 20 N-terminal domain-containing protein n=1 Tax=Brachionus calyciflorus TaxID=104777 RepID=A0A814A7B9_9BILA|nr:unnamed protein product [Brachionus calyciflorus]
MLHSQVSFADFKEYTETLTLKLPFNLKAKILSDELYMDTLILRPYVTSIINHIEKIVSLNMSKKTLPAKPLKILARISSFAANSQIQCEKIILLLIPYLLKNRTQSEENEINILSSMNFLIKQVKCVRDFIPPLSRLFLIIKNRQSRQELCNIFVSIREKDSNFELLSKLVILPNLISYFESQINVNYQQHNLLEKTFLSLITEYLLVHKKVLDIDYSNTETIIDNYDHLIKTKGLIHLNRLFQGDKKYIESKLNKKITEFIITQIDTWSSDSDILISSLITCPILIVKNSLLIEKIRSLSIKIIDQIDLKLNEESFEDKEMTQMELNCYFLSLTIRSLSLLSETVSSNLIINLICKLNRVKESLKKLKINFDLNSFDLSSNHLLHCLYLCENNEKNDLSLILHYLKIELCENENILDICLKTELTPASLDEYRQKIYYLQKLDPIVCNKLINSENVSKEIPLRYLFGILYENFKLLWEPSVKLIQSWAADMKINDFWQIFSEFLSDLTHKIECKGHSWRKRQNKMDIDENEMDFNLMKCLDKYRYANMNSIDYMNNRLLMCKSMQGFASICEGKTRMLIPLFFRFMK